MSYPTPIEPAAPRRNADYRWTRDKLVAFIAALGRCGKVAEAARSVGMSRQAAYRLRARIPGLDEPWREAQAAGRARRRAHGRRRGKLTVRPAQGDASGAAK